MVRFASQLLEAIKVGCGSGPKMVRSVIRASDARKAICQQVHTVGSDAFSDIAPSIPPAVVTSIPSSRVVSEFSSSVFLSKSDLGA